ncbi:MAG: helicase-exonuclease AddAB subunit AddB [Peptococcaceae bacterium]
MTLRFIIGRAGSGKTTCCLNEIREQLLASQEGRNLILLVPEQATFQNELELAATPLLRGSMRAQVYSFHRLAWRILQEVGGSSKVHIGELGKHMLIRQFIENRSGELKVFSGASERPGFIDSLAASLTEFKLYEIKVADIRALLEDKPEEDSLLFSKLKDLSLIYQDLEEYLEGSFIDPDDYLSLLAQKVPAASTVRNAEIWLDGFTGFTPQELTVIAALLSTAPRVNITLTLQENQEIFNLTNKTFTKLSEIAVKLGVSIERPQVLKQEIPPRFRASEALAYLEKSFFAVNAGPFRGAADDLKLISAQNHRAEVEGIAREIRRLCREEGYRYKDIAVLLRDFANYDLFIETVFADYEIPFFIDRKRTVLHHPLVELIRSALEVVNDDWCYPAVFRYLKTDLTNISRSEIDILENYVLAHGIRGQAWYADKPWQYGGQQERDTDQDTLKNAAVSLEEINEIRFKAIKELQAFQDKLKQSGTVSEAARTIFELLADLAVAQKLESWSDSANAEGRLETAQEHNQIWDDVLDILDQIVETLGANPLESGSLQKVIDAGFAGLRLGIIPPGLDHTLVGSLERTRNPNLKAVFLLGVGDGILPARPVSEGLFNDQERELLKDSGLELAPGAKEKLFDEEFIVYTALTRAGKYLVLSYPLADSEGRGLKPSGVIRRIKELFPQIKETYIGIEPSGIKAEDLEFISHYQKTLAYLGTKLRQAKEGQPVEPIWWDAYHWLLHDSKGRQGLQRVIEGLFHGNQVQPIDPGLARKLLGNPLRVSVSRLEKFQACPFAYFSTYGLSLRERQIFKLTQPDLGRFFHAALEQLATKMAAKNLDWEQVNKKQVLTISNEVTEDLIPQVQGEILLSSARYRYLSKKFKKTVQRAALILMEHARRGKFKPVGLEVAFGPQGRLPALKLTLEDGTEMELVGRIDRVDAVLKGEQYVLRVIDYKSGNAGLSLLEVFYGLKLQLLTYLDIILTYGEKLVNSTNIQPGGVLYFYLKDPFINSTGPLSDEEIEAGILKELKMQGLLLADAEVFRLTDGATREGWSPIIPAALTKEGTFHKNSKVATLEQLDLLREHIRNLIKKAGQSILQGEVGISPYQLKDFKACSYCSFQAVCQFDRQVEGNDYRTIKPLENEEVWKLLTGQGENEELRIEN